MASKISNTQFAYYIADDIKDAQLISIDDAILRLESDITLSGHLFDVEAYEDGNLVPVKFVFSMKKRPYFAVKALTTAKGGTHNLVQNGLSVLHEEARKFIMDKNYNGIAFGDSDLFLVASDYITDIRSEVVITEPARDKSRLITVRPDLIIETLFMHFFIEIKVSHGLDEQKITDYKELLKTRAYGMPFCVVEIDLSDLQDKCKAFGFKSIEDEVVDRILYNSEYKHIHTLVSLKYEDAPFGYSPHSGLPFTVFLNSGADTINPDLRKLIRTNENLSSCISIGYLEHDALNSVFLTDISAEHPYYPVGCPEHWGTPIRLVMQAEVTNTGERLKGCPNRRNIFWKCDKYRSKTTLNHRQATETRSECEVTMSFCRSDGTLVGEYLVSGGLDNFILDSDNVLNRIKFLRSSNHHFKQFESLRR